MPNYLAQWKIQQQFDNTHYIGIARPKSLFLKPKRMGSCTMDNGPILNKERCQRHLQNTAETLPVFVSNAAQLRLRVREFLAPSNPPLPLQLPMVVTVPAICY
jgi:hypothetical protein